ncbi:MAG: YceI family protein [Candidatus Omnitrophica bacterium]|nr:YceI family protein [Candidatus Omnitrophota bacterium]
MKKVLQCIAVSVALTTLSGGAVFSQETAYVIDKDHSRMDFSFRSTLHRVEGEVHGFEGIFHGRPELTYLTDGEVDIKTQSLDTNHPERNEHMYHMFDSEHFPRIHYQLSEVVGLPAVDGPAGQMILKGMLTIKDLKKPVEIPANIEKTSAGLIVKGGVDLSLKDFHLKPPSVLVLIRVFDTVHVDFQILLTEEGS